MSIFNHGAADGLDGILELYYNTDMKKAKIFQKGWNFSQDGPGNRLLYHFQGCNLFCPWCSNPEGISVEGTLIVNKKFLLDSVCPRGAIKDSVLNREVCKECMTRECINKNRSEGISMSCDSYSIEEIVEEAVNARHLFHSGGGVTMTGGEPTLQFNFIFELLKRLKSNNINTAVETNGIHSRLSEVFTFIDTLIIDFKHYDNDIHRKTLGSGNEGVKSNIRNAASNHKNLWLRITLIPGFNSSSGDMDSFLDFIKTLKRDNIYLEFLSYHEYGKVKWEQCGMDYRMGDVRIDREIVMEYQNMFRDNGVEVINT